LFLICIALVTTLVLSAFKDEFEWAENRYTFGAIIFIFFQAIENQELNVIFFVRFSQNTCRRCLSHLFNILNMEKNLIFIIMLCLASMRASAQAVDTAAVVRVVDSLIQVSRAFTEQEDFVKAVELNVIAEKLALENLGRETAAYGNACFNHGRILLLKSKLPEAEKWLLEARDIRAEVLGREHPLYATVLGRLAELYRRLGNYEKAEPLYLEALAIYEKVLGKEHADYATDLGNLGNLYLSMGRFEKAEPIYLEAKDRREKVFGKEHRLYAGIVSNLAVLYTEMGNYEKAEIFYIEAISIRGIVLGKEHSNYAEGLVNLGIMYWKTGSYEKAEPLYLQAIDILEKALGTEHPDFAGTLINLGLLYSDMGNYEKAEACYVKAKEIFEDRIKNFNHPFYINSLMNLANLYQNMGSYEKAELLYINANAAYERVEGKEHPSYAGGLFNLANLYAEMGSYNKAEALYRESQAIREKVLGSDHPDYAASLHNLANLYRKMGNLKIAEKLHLEALAIKEKKLGRNNPAFAFSLDNLGLLCSDLGSMEKAELLLTEASDIRKKVLGKDHPDYARSVNNLSILYWNLGDYEKATSCITEYALLNQSLIARASRHLSEQELNRFLITFSADQAQLLSLIQIANSNKLLQTGYDNSLFFKGFLLNANIQIKRLALADPDAAVKFNQMKSYERRLAAEYTNVLTERDTAKIAMLEAEANTLEKDIARTVAGYGEAMRQVKWKEVQSALKPGESAVEFVHYRYYTPQPTDSTMYAAIVLRPGDTQPLFIPLFEEKELTPLLRGAAGGSNFLKINALYADKTADSKQKSLYELIWQPLGGLLSDCKTVYCAPSGLLHRINLAAVATNEGEVYGERRQVVALGSTRQLVVPHSSNQTSSNTAYLAGGIRYDSDSTTIAYANRGASSRSLEPGALTFLPDSLSITRGGVLDYLPATAAEVRDIGQTLSATGLQTKVDTGFYATEESFRQLGVGSPSPRIVHLATHGYFFPDPAVSKKQLAIGNEPVFKISEHPMIRSGLILAGAKQAWLTGKHPEGQEDGILTAYEISQMNLSGTELVVLSACETGLGDIVGNEGVYGLQRAFKIAGAKYLIMSLWKVDDRSTRAFMTTFYRHWLTEKQTVPRAFRATQREMRAKYSGVYDWAGFVLVE